MKILRERGLHEFLRELSKKIYFEYQANWYVCDLAKPTTSFFSKSGNFKVVNDILDKTISWMIALSIPGIASHSEIENIRNQRHLIYTLLANDLIAGYIIVGKGQVYILDFDQNIYFPQQKAFVMDTFIHDDFRGRKLFHFLISSVMMDLRRKGYKKLYCHIRKDNLTSISAYEASGFKKIGIISYKKKLWSRKLVLPRKFLTERDFAK